MSHEKKKIIFYSHDSFGLGHFRRTMTICNYISRKIPELSLFIITGSEMAQSFKMLKNVELIRLPSVVKVDNEEYRAKRLNITFDEIKNKRERIIFKTIRELGPHIFMVDNVPLGLKGEILKTLEFLRKNSPRTKIVLSMRDILDDPDYIIAHWNQHGVYQVLDEYYDQILIYGCPEIYNVIQNYRLPPEIARKVKFCGYISRENGKRGARSIRKSLNLNGEKFVLVTVGGGGDGYNLVHSYLVSIIASEQNNKIKSLIALGHDMPEQEKKKLLMKYHGKSNLLFFEFHNDLLSYMNAADLVVSMAGYNTVCEILSLNKKALVIPRIYPRREQLIRARLMERLGLLQMIYPPHINQNRMITQITSILDMPEQKNTLQEINFNGLPTVVSHIKKILSGQNADIHLNSDKIHSL